MNHSCARVCAALLAACAAAIPSLALAGRTLLVPGAERLADAQAAVLVTQRPDPFDLTDNQTVIEAVGTGDGVWTPLGKMRSLKGPDSRVRVHAFDDLINLAPGRYQLRVACYGGDYERIFEAQPIEVAAGQEYVIECRGRTQPEARVHVATQPRLPHGATRPLRTGRVDVPAGHDAARVGQAVKAALANRGWQIADEESGRIDATLHVRKHAVTIRIQYDPQDVTFAYLDGNDLDPHVEDGEAALHYNYYHWIYYLGVDVGLHLAGETLTQ